MLRKLIQFLKDATDPHCFIVELRGSQAHVAKGHVPPKFIVELTEYAKHNGLAEGRIYGEKKESYVHLSFSPEIPSEKHHPIRTIWHFHEPHGHRT